MMRYLYRSGQGVLTVGSTPEDVRKALADGGGTVWLDLVPLPEKRAEWAGQLCDLFHFHPLALDDALKECHVPRIDDWQDYLYVVLHALDLEINQSLDSHELDVFLGRSYLVTIHDEPIQALDKVWEQCARGAADRVLAAGPDRLLYALADHIVEDYMPVVDGLDEAIDDLEDEIFNRPNRDTVGRIARHRRTLLHLRRLFNSLREVMHRLARNEYAVIDEADRVYFRDVYDHLVRLYDIVDGLRDLVMGAMESFMSVTSNRLNEIMRTLTVATVLFLPLNLVVGFFGMNFFGEAFNVTDPVSSSTLFVLCLAIMLITPPVMLWWMARKGWLRPVVSDSEPDEDRVK